MNHDNIILSHIVAAAKNNVIGHKGELPWSIPEDMKFFRDTTKGKAIIMGRKTFESMGHPLPQRLNVVITRQKDYKADNAVVVSTLEEAIAYCRERTDEYGSEIFIIGGGEIFTQSLPIIDRIYLTRIHQDFPGDAFYPDFDPKQFKEVHRSDRTMPIPFTFFTYERIRS